MCAFVHTLAGCLTTASVSDVVRLSFANCLTDLFMSLFSGPASSSHCSPASQRVFRTRYKMVTRPGSSAAHTPQYNPALSWRAKRIQSAR